MEKILVIDDKSDNLISIKALLKCFIPDCIIQTAQSGKEGINTAINEKPDTILLDIIMPEMDGYEVCRILKEDELTKHIPVILLTAIRTDSKSRVKGLELGADAFLSKPIDPSELTAQINVMLRIKFAEDKLRSEKVDLEKLVTARTTDLSEMNKKLLTEIEEHNLAQEKLIVSEERFRQIAANSKEMIWEVDQNGLYTFASQVAENMFGYKIDEIIGKKYFFDFFIPEEREELMNSAFEVFKERKPFQEFINRNMTRNGEIIWLSTNGIPVLDDNGNLLGYRGADINITERKNAEEELKKHREHLEDLVKERTAELEEINAELEQLNNLFVDREFRIKELRDQVTALKGDQGVP